jgi:DNA invertase Pin-like site-specific DNA recombinase
MTQLPNEFDSQTNNVQLRLTSRTQRLRAALYSRVSTKDKGQETENQFHQLREFCAVQGWLVIQEYEDHESGGKPDRSQFQAMMADAARRHFDLVLFWALDRFSREGALATLQHLNQLSNYGVAFRSFSEPYLDSCGIFKDAVIAILGTIAKQERVRISERVRAGLHRARVQGTKSGKPIGRPKVVFARDKVQELRAQGFSWRDISRRMGASVASVRRACQSTQPS